jgi:hypothetical protein
MSTLTFDTHEFIKTLTDSGFEPRQAEAVSKAFKTASGEAELATKRDLDTLKMELTLKMAEHKADTIKWMVGLSLAQLGLLIGILLKLTA